MVVRHLVADAVRRPPERELGQVAGAEHERPVVVREPEQVRGALAGLHVLVRDVVDGLAVGGRVAEVAEHLRRRRADVDLEALTPSARISRCALPSVWSLVAKPGIVYASTFSRGSPRRSTARAATISACVESRPPETPITIFSMPVACSRVSSPRTWML